MLHFQLLGGILEMVVISENEVEWKGFDFKLVELVRWHAVASWTWDAQDETCGICRMAFDGCCPDCKLPGDDCPLSKLLLMILLATFIVIILGCMQSRISFALYPEMGEFSDITSALPHVPSGVAV
ncbi:hypothetical protein JHK87_028063 [Glycine soja]|nr:hypothetical protein JHK87_028063 [Glycine soja]